MQKGGYGKKNKITSYMFHACMANLLKINELVDAFLKNDGIEIILRSLKA